MVSEDAAAYAARRAAALARLVEDDPRGAFDGFRWALWFTGPTPPDRERLADALGVLARITVAMGHRELAERCARASTDIDDPDALYELGYELIEVGLPAIAATVLWRCLDVVPGSEQVVIELVAALERLLRYGDALALLRAHPALAGGSFVCRYHLAFDAIMAGELDAARDAATRLAPAPDDGDQAFMAARIAAMLARADRLAGVAPLDATDLRGWHHVVTGGVLLHRSPHGFAEAMRGRYAWLQDTRSLVCAGVERLAGVLAAWGMQPPCVYAPPGRDHDVLAALVTRTLGVPRAPWPVVGVPAPGLVVAYDLADVAWRDLERLVERRPGQLLYAQAGRWVEDGPVAPDVTMLLHQSVIAPWGARLVVDGEGATRRADPDDRPAEVVAAEIAAADPLDADDVAADDLPGLSALVEAAGAPEVGRRERLWGGSPVRSNRFE